MLLFGLEIPFCKYKCKFLFKLSDHFCVFQYANEISSVGIDVAADCTSKCSERPESPALE